MKIPGPPAGPRRPVNLTASGGGGLSGPEGGGFDAQSKPVSSAGNRPHVFAAKTTLDNIQSLFSALKIPDGGLSESVVAFARFFALPLEPKLIASIRGAALSGAQTGERTREAAALGAAAAADKGVSLSAGALKEYAAAIDGWDDQGENGGNRDDGAASGDGGGTGGEKPGFDEGGTGGAGGDRKDSAKDRKRPEDWAEDWGLSAGQVCRRFQKILRENPPLDLINRLPGKNGRRWITLPFSFARDGVEFTVSVRLLLNSAGQAADGAFPQDRLSVDVKVRRPGKDENRRWLIILDRTDGGPSSASLFLQDGWFGTEGPGKQPDRKRLGKELAKALELPFERITVRDGGSFFADSRDDAPRPVDEEV